MPHESKRECNCRRKKNHQEFRIQNEKIHMHVGIRELEPEKQKSEVSQECHIEVMWLNRQWH